MAERLGQAPCGELESLSLVAPRTQVPIHSNICARGMTHERCRLISLQHTSAPRVRCHLQQHEPSLQKKAPRVRR